ncbi:unnamed protein product [Effrenium voratum]|nr:unnamed protein product [Effrenium voratum]
MRGGFAGLAAVRHLRRDFDVTLIDAKQYFEFLPGMVRPYSQPDLHQRLVLDYAAVCDKMKVTWIWGAAEKITDKEVIVHLKNRTLGKFRNLPYDYCIVATGCEHGSTLWAVSSEARTDPRWEPRCAAGRQTQIQYEHDRLVRLDAEGGHVAVIGAGYVGVEFAAELRHYFPRLQISLVSRNVCCCPTMGKGARVYIQKYLDKHNISTFYGAKYVDSNSTQFWRKLGQSTPTRVFRSIGMTPHCDFLPSDCLTDRGWVKCMPTLQVARAVEDTLVPFAKGNIFTIGNCADKVPGLDPLPKNSFPAEEMAAHCARNIRRMERGRKLKTFYWPWLSGVSATSLGPKDGVLLVNNRLPGSGFVALRGRAVVWLKELIRWSKVDECKLGLWGTLLWHFVH